MVLTLMLVLLFSSSLEGVRHGGTTCFTSPHAKGSHRSGQLSIGTRSSAALPPACPFALPFSPSAKSPTPTLHAHASVPLLRSALAQLIKRQSTDVATSAQPS